jgi:hypothetical protein
MAAYYLENRLLDCALTFSTLEDYKVFLPNSVSQKALWC